MTITKQFNQTMPPHFEASRTQVNVGIVAATKTMDEVAISGYEYYTVFFQSPELYTDDALFGIAKKETRAYELSKLVIEVDGFTLDADETSQERLSRSYGMLSDGESIPWKDANNTFVSIPKETIKKAIILAGTKQTELWVKYA